MQKNITLLGPKEAGFLSLMSSKGRKEFTNEEAAKFWGSSALAKKKLYLLEKKGWVTRLERGKYIVVPLEAGPERQWSEDPEVIAAALVQPAAIAYWSALRHWNWTEQIPHIVYVQTTTRKKQTRSVVMGVQYEFVTVSKRKFYGNTKEWRNGKAVFVTDKEKTLVDCADDVERAGTIEELAKAIKSASTEISWRKLDECVRKFPNGAVKKRLGYLFETLVPSLSGEARSFLAGWQRELSAGVAPLQPSTQSKGRVVTRWHVRVNATLS